MHYDGKAALRSGETAVIRSLRPQDAQAAIWLIHQVMGETPYMSSYPDEIHLTAAQEIERIECAAQDENGVMLGAFVNGALVSIGHVTPVSRKERMRHRASLGVSVVQAHWGKGVGPAMLQALLEAMRPTGIEQIELVVVAENRKAIALYRRFGFVEFGRHPHAFRYRDGSYADLLLMALDLRAQG